MALNSLKYIEKEFLSIEEMTGKSSKECDRLVESYDSLESRFNDRSAGSVQQLVKIDFELTKIEERIDTNQTLIDAARDKLKALVIQWNELEERLLLEN